MGVVSRPCKWPVRIGGRSPLRTQLKGIERDLARAPVLPDQIMLERLRKFDELLSSRMIRQGRLLDICDFFAGLNYGLSPRSFSLAAFFITKIRLDRCICLGSMHHGFHQP